MSVFKGGDKEWVVEINVSQARLVRSRLKWPDGRPLDLYRLADDGMRGLAALLDDPILLVDCVWLLCSEQARGRGVTDEQFGRALYGDGLARMIDAFLGALADFFHSPTQRAQVLKMRELMALMEQDQAAKIDGLDLKEELRKAEEAGRATQGAPPNGSSTARPASAASTPAPSPSAS